MGAPLTLLTDFGTEDSFAAVMKGVILSTNPSATIVDITHSIEPQNIRAGAFVLATAYSYFPKDTIHVAVVDPGVGSQRRGIILRVPGAFFVAPDNGLLTYVIDHLSLSVTPPGPGTEATMMRLKRGIEAVSITDPRFWRHPVSPTFHGRDIFAPVAGGLSLGLSPYEFGEKTDVLTVLPVQRPYVDNAGDVVGEIIHIDRFGNLVTNIRSSNLPPGSAEVRVGGVRIGGIRRFYEEGEGLTALLGSSGYLEIALRNGNAARYLEAMEGDKVRVTSTI
ncbi:MAG TPA: S-adenosyl-l-methionine hydroxide adenosyltransferase [Dehalococcoidia bacterium]|nr:S-adenosyl-l-methionine hydroxide adenosyltransferase [Dehalococcoidia bacterium]